MTVEGTDANVSELINAVFNNPMDATLELTQEAVIFSPEIGSMIAVGFVIILLIFSFLVPIGIILHYARKK